MSEDGYLCALCASSFDGPERIRQAWYFVLEQEEDEQEIEQWRRGISLFDELCPKSALRWHEHLRALSFNTASHHIQKAYITGHGHDGYGLGGQWGSVLAHPGNEPNAPKMPSGASGEVELTPYALPNRITDTDPAIPMHYECLFHILPKVVGFMSDASSGSWRNWTVDQLDRGLLWDTFHPLLEEYQICPNLDHFERNVSKTEECWLISRDDFSCVSNPYEIPSLVDYLRKLPRIFRIGHKEHERAITASNYCSCQHLDLFTRLSLDLSVYLSDFLSLKDFFSLRLASRQVASLSIGSTFWKRRIHLDMPWIWEVHAFRSDAPRMSESTNNVMYDGTEIDWKAVYRTLHADSFCAPRLGPPLAGQPGLWNRRRIWKTCEQFAILYHERRKRLQAYEPLQCQDEEIVKCTFSSQTPTVATGVVHDSTPFKIPLLLKWNQNIKRMNLLTYWGNDSLLVGIEVIDRSHATNKRLGSVGQTSLVEKRCTEFSSPGMIKGLEILLRAPDLSKTKITGHCDIESLSGIIGLRLHLESGTIKHACPTMHPSEISQRFLRRYQGSTVVGLHGAVSGDNRSIITRLGLMEAIPFSEQPPTNVAVPLRETHSWKNGFPKAVYQAQEEKIGCGQGKVAHDATPREALIFGATNAERTHITGIAIDDALRRFEVFYDDRPSRCIGNARENFYTSKNFHRYPRMKHFPIAGREGERIVAVRVQPGHLPTALQVYTTRGRYTTFGAHCHHGYFLGFDLPDEKEVGGLYACFGCASGKINQLSSLSLLLVDSDTKIDETSNGELDHGSLPIDGNRNFWDDARPPSDWKLEGPVYGSDETECTVTFVDLTRPISRIDTIQYCSSHNRGIPSPQEGSCGDLVARCHPSTARPFLLWLKGLRIVYADGQVRYLAATPADEPEPLGGLGETVEDRITQLCQGIRFTTRWQIREQGKRVSRVRVWSSENVPARWYYSYMEQRGCTFGMQFGTDDEWGPRWGDCYKEPTAELEIGVCKGDVVGLKIVVGEGVWEGWEVSKMCQDPVTCRGVQAFVLKE